MKKLALTLFIFGAFLCTVNAQNPLFVSFNLTQDSVVKFLTAKSGTKYEVISNHLLHAYRNGNYLAYYFNDNGGLYKIKLFKNYDKKKDAFTAQESVLNYYTLSNSTVVEEGGGTDDKVKSVAIKDGVINEVYTIRTLGGGYQLQIITKNPEFDPMTEQDDGTPVAEFKF